MWITVRLCWHTYSRRASSKWIPTMLADTLVVLDFETTGLRPDHGDRITEVAALRMRNGVAVARYESLVNCQRRLPNHIRAFTGINQHMVDHAPASEQVLAELLDFIGNDPVISHNAAFDQGFLDCECERLGLQRRGEDFICTVQLSRRLLPELDSHSLHALVRHFHLTAPTQHRAGADAEATAQVLLQLCNLLETHTSVCNLRVLKQYSQYGDHHHIETVCPEVVGSALVA
jgi:DNA polymerase III subunit epsilon